jgi:hypothetical protein
MRERISENYRQVTTLETWAKMGNNIEIDPYHKEIGCGNKLPGFMKFRKFLDRLKKD